jgi:hypothetical protein
MPTLIVQHPAAPPRGLVLDGRALIGRRPFNTVMVPDPAVSRIHAWIGTHEGRYVLFDAGSRLGTRVNGQPVKAPRLLADGDEIAIGGAVLTYSDADDLPDDVPPMGPPAPPPAADPYDGGIYFDCACGGPMWVTADLAGKTGRCRYCGERLVVPHASGAMARPVLPNVPAAAAAPPAAPPKRRPPTPVSPPPPPPEIGPAGRRVTTPAPAPAPPPQPAAQPQPAPETCSICQTDILPEEDRTVCPSCELTFHAQCWQENYGCSAYGCDQVNVLAPPPPAADQPQNPTLAAATAATAETDTEYDAHAAPDEARPAFPWESVLLALSFVAMALGALAYGIPSAVVLVAALILLLTGKAERRGVVVLAILIALIGVAAGYATSMFWWKGVRVWEALLR